jgi:hypothetical protein
MAPATMMPAECAEDIGMAAVVECHGSKDRTQARAAALFHSAREVSGALFSRPTFSVQTGCAREPVGGAGRPRHENIGWIVSRNGRRLMTVARATQIYSLSTPFTRTLQQQFCDRISCFGFGGLSRKLEHFRRVEWVYHLHRRAPRLLVSRRHAGQRDSDCDSGSGNGNSRVPDQSAPPACRGDTQNQSGER